MISIVEWMMAAGEVSQRDREELLAETLGISKSDILAKPETQIPEAELERINHALQRLRLGEPLAYVLGNWEFWGLTLKLTSQTLIPRPETELLVETVIRAARENAQVLDLGTGCGAIAIAIAHERPDLKVTATDCAPGPLAVARSNAERLQVDVEFIASDWFSELTGQWDIIVSNPPYVALEDAHLESLQYEPQGALVSGPTGLDDLTRIVIAAPAYLHNNGVLTIEHGYNQGTAVRGLFTTAGLEQIETRRDLGNNERMTYGYWR